MTEREQANKRAAQIDLVDSLYEARQQALGVIRDLKNVIAILDDVVKAIPANRIDMDTLDDQDVLKDLLAVAATALGTCERDDDLPKGRILDRPSFTIRRMAGNVNDACSQVSYLLRGDFTE